MRRQRSLSRLASILKKLRELSQDRVEVAIRSGLVVGEQSRVYATDFGSEPWLIEIGTSSIISVGVRFLTHDGSAALAVDEKGRRYSYASIKIGDRVFIGAGCILLPGINIGNDVVIGAGSVVTHSFPDGVVIAGNPAKQLGLTSELVAKFLSQAPSETDRHNRSLKGFSVECAQNQRR